MIYQQKKVGEREDGFLSWCLKGDFRVV